MSASDGGVPALVAQWRQRFLRIAMEYQHGQLDSHQAPLAWMVEQCARNVAAWQARPEPEINCPVCGTIVKQVASDTLSLALWQHWNWKCDGNLAAGKDRP